MPMMGGMDLDSALLRSTLAAGRALDDKLRSIGFYAMRGYPLSDHLRFQAVADNLELEGLRRDRTRAGATR